MGATAARGPARPWMFEALHMLTAGLTGSAAARCRSVEAEVWAGNVSEPLWSMKDLWIRSTPAAAAGGLWAKRPAGRGASTTLWWTSLCFRRHFLPSAQPAPDWLGGRLWNSVHLHCKLITMQQLPESKRNKLVTELQMSLRLKLFTLHFDVL